MNDMKEKAMGAVKAFLERKGYEIVDEAWQGPEGIGGIDLVAVDEDGTLVFVDATGSAASEQGSVAGSGPVSGSVAGSRRDDIFAGLDGSRR